MRVDKKHTTRTDRYRLYALYDIHLGAAACDEKLLKADIARIATDPNAIVILGGDVIDAIARHDPRAGQPTLADWCKNEQDILGAEIDYFLELIYPIQDKIAAFIEGNHEYAPERHDSRGVYYELCKGVARKEGMSFSEERAAAAKIALGTEGFIKLHFERRSPGTKGDKGPTWECVIYARHGYGGGRKPGAKVNNLHDMLSTYDCDLGLTGHVHEKLYTSYTRVSAGKGKEPYRLHTSQGVVCGTYLKSYIDTRDDQMPRNTYGQRANYFPRPHGCVGPITIIPSKREIVINMSNVPGFLED